MSQLELFKEETFHWCPRKKQVLNILALENLCPSCEKSDYIKCTAWRKYHCLRKGASA